MEWSVNNKFFSSRLKLFIRMNNIHPVILITKRTVALLIAIVFFFTFTIWWLNHLSFCQNVWNPFEMNNKFMYSFCEKAIISNPIRQPVNTFSSIIYLIVAVIIFKNTKRNINSVSDNMNQFYESFLGWLLICVCICSVLFHATLGNIPLKLDFTAVCAFAIFPSIYFLQHLIFKKIKILNPVLKGIFLLLFSVTLFLLSLFTHHEKHSLEMLLLILISFILSFIVSNKNNTNRKYLFFSMASVIVAIIWFELDRYKIFCNPDSYLQPHSLWHIFIGLSAFYFYRYMLGQREKINT